MIRFGLRLALAGGREALVRLIMIGSAVALGVGMLLTIVVGVHAVTEQSARYAWLDTGMGESTVDGPLWFILREDYYDRHPIARVDVAASGTDAPVLPGIPRLPGPGEYFASPALAELLGSTPADQLADRYPGRLVGTIAKPGVPDPGALVVIVGHRPDEMAGVSRVSAINSEPEARRAMALDLILSVVAAGLLFPVLIFIGTATRLTAARREERFAAMRLIGATPRQISVISAVESTAAAVLGTAVGFGLFLLCRGELARIPFTGMPFYRSDLTLTILDVLLVGLGVPLASALAARVALRRVRISPLGVTRRATPRPPRPYRLILLFAGIAELAYFIGRRPPTSNGQVAAFLPGFLLIMAGLVVAGPYLTMVGARLMARRSRRPATLIAARRLADNPRAGFRAISGLVLALFVTSVAIGVITTIVANRGPHPGSTADTALSIVFDDGTPPGDTAWLRAMPGVERVMVIHRGTGDGLRDLLSCDELARSDASCPPGTTRWIGPFTDPEPAPYTPAQLAGLPVRSIVVGTDGSTAAIERVRTRLELAYPRNFRPPLTDPDFENDFTRTLVGWQQLANVVVLASLPIAGCSLAVSVAGGLSERKRPFSLLRLSGAPLRVLRRVVALESAVPLLIVAAVAMGVGFVAAQLFLTAQMGYTLVPPGPGYYLIVLIGIAASLAIIASTMPLLERVTGPETARND